MAMRSETLLQARSWSAAGAALGARPVASQLQPSLETPLQRASAASRRAAGSRHSAAKSWSRASCQTLAVSEDGPVRQRSLAWPTSLALKAASGSDPAILSSEFLRFVAAHGRASDPAARGCNASSACGRHCRTDSDSQETMDLMLHDVDAVDVKAN